MGSAMQTNRRITKGARQPVVRISKGRFDQEKYPEVRRLIDESATPLAPAIQALGGLLYYHAGLDPNTNTVVNVSVWENEQAARQMDALAPMLAQRPILESAGVQFDKIANYEPAWKIESNWGNKGTSFEKHPAIVDESDSEQFEAQVKLTGARWSKLGLSSRFVPANGVDLHVVEGGSGRPLVLLHGYPQSGEIWRLIAPELARSHRVIIPDLRGMGLSGIAPSGYDLPNLAEDIHQLVRRLDLGEVDVVGHDWGGAVAAVYALRYRDEVRKLTFVESAVGGAGFETIWTFAQPNPAMTFIPFLLTGALATELISGREEQFLRHLWNTFTANKERATFDTWQPYVAAMKRPGLIHSSSSYYSSVYGAIDIVRAMIGQGKLTIPVLSVSGRSSFGTAQRGFVDAFASNIVRDVVIDGAGHFVAEEQPQALEKEVKSFLAK